MPESSTSKRTIPPTCGSTVTSTTRTGRGHIHSCNDSRSSHSSNTTSGAAGMTRCTRTVAVSVIACPSCVAAPTVHPRASTRTPSARISTAGPSSIRPVVGKASARGHAPRAARARPPPTRRCGARRPRMSSAAVRPGRKCGRRPGATSPTAVAGSDLRARRTHVQNLIFNHLVDYTIARDVVEEVVQLKC